MGFYIIGDIIKNTRLAMNMSQEKLAEGICMPNYLSRIECGKQVPQKNIYNMLMDKLESKMNKMEANLEVDEFVLLEKQWGIAQAMSKFEYKKAQGLLWELEVELDQQYLINQQYIKFIKAVINYRRKRISLEQYRIELKESIKLTIPKYHELWKINRVLSRNEVNLLILIYGTYGEEGKYEKAIGLYADIIKYYEELYPEGNRKYYLLALNHLSKWYGLIGKNKEAIHIAKKGIKECIKMKKQSSLTQFLYDIAWNLNELLENGKYSEEKRWEIEKKCRNYILNAYGISIAYNQIQDSIFYKDKMKVWFK